MQVLSDGPVGADPACRDGGHNCQEPQLESHGSN
jgi:hypothetical protein